MIHDEILDRINVPTNPLALALRISACQLVGINPQRYQGDLELLMSLQGEDGGWPVGHFCCTGRTRERIGSRGLTTAPATKTIREEQLRA